MIIVEDHFAGVEFPLEHPRIGGARYGGTVAASGSAPGFDAENAASPTTGQWWRPDAVPATWALTFDQSRPVSYIGIAAHKCGTNGATLNFQTWNGAAWVTRISHTPTDNSPIFALLKRTSHTAARVQVVDAVASIGVIYIGDVREFPQLAEYVGSVPFNETQDVQLTVPLSDEGQWLGAFVKRKAGSASMLVSHISEDWNAAYLQPMIEDMKTAPVFIADRPGSEPQSVAYAYTTSRPDNTRDTPNRRVSRSVQFELKAHGH